MTDHQRVETAIDQLGSYGIAVDACASAAAFTQGLDAAALCSSVDGLFRTPPPVHSIDPEAMVEAGGAALAEACATQQVFEQGIVDCAQSARDAANMIANVAGHAADAVEDVLGGFERQLEKAQLAMESCPPEWIKSLGDSAQSTICDIVEQRNTALEQCAQQLTADCTTATQTAGLAEPADSGAGEEATEVEPDPVEQTLVPEAAEASEPQIKPEEGFEKPAPEPVEPGEEPSPEPSGPESAKPESAGWDPDIWIAAGAGIEVEADLERSGQW